MQYSTEGIELSSRIGLICLKSVLPICATIPETSTGWSKTISNLTVLDLGKNVHQRILFCFDHPVCMVMSIENNSFFHACEQD